MNTTYSPAMTSAALEPATNEMFVGLPSLDKLKIKQLELSTHLTALMVYGNETRSNLASKLNWKKSRLTHVFSGRGNSTIRTIFELTDCLGYEFDIVFRLPEGQRPLQPWEASLDLQLDVTQETPSAIIVQTADQVERDLRQGTGRSYYFSINIDQPLSTQALPDQSLILDGYVAEQIPSTTDNFAFIEP